MLMNIELPALCFQTRHVVQPATGAQEKHQISTPFKTEKIVTHVDFDTKCNTASYDITVLGQTLMLKENFTKQGVRTTMFMLWKRAYSFTTHLSKTADNPSCCME